MIIVTGGSGQLGHAIVEQLLKRVAASEIGVSVRDPNKVADLSARGVRVRKGDFDDEAGLRVAFEGATQVLLVSSNVAARGGDPIAQHRTAIAAAKHAGARRIVYTSHQSASPTSAFAPARDHATTEALLETSGLRFTSLRNGYYASTVPLLLGGALESGELRAPADGKVSWTAHADLAAVAALILSEEGRFEGPVTLTASESLDLADVAALASSVTGRPITRVTLSDEDYVASLVARGLPKGAVSVFMSSFLASRAGEFDRTDKALEALLGRKPIPLRAVFEGASA